VVGVVFTSPRSLPQSRATIGAYVVQIRCSMIEDMRLVNALCRFVELATDD